jgi:Sec-independent protein translocase protein TatA
MADEKEKRTGSALVFMRAYQTYIIMFIGLLFFVMKEKIAGGLPQLAQAQAECKTLIAEQQKEITRLDKETALQKQEQCTILEKVNSIDAKIDRLIRRNDG